jgi:hypothetical protein
VSRIYEPSQKVEAAAVAVKGMSQSSLRRLRGKIDAEMEGNRRREFWRKAEQARRRGHKLATFPIPARARVDESHGGAQ